MQERKLQPNEEKLLQTLQVKSSLNQIWKAFDTLLEQPMGQLSEAFMKHADFRAYGFRKYVELGFQAIQLRLLIEDYLLLKKENKNVTDILTWIDNLLKSIMKDVTPVNKARGMVLLPEKLANAKFMRELYSLDDNELNAVFLKYLSYPRPNIFEGKPLPKIIAERAKDSSQAIQKFLQKHKNDLSTVEYKVTQVQRQFRALKRKKENLKRIPFIFQRMSHGGQDVKEILQDANRAYRPQCNPKLAKRLIKAASQVELFSTVRHLTHPSALQSIFNDGLYGRSTLLEFYLPFKPASLDTSLDGCDLNEGDANVICMGANLIDPKASKGVELTFDAKKIAHNNRTVFYKQRDLGFNPNIIREAKIDNLQIYFTHTHGDPEQAGGITTLRYLDKSKEVKSPLDEASILNTTLISYNLNQMHQILTLNFFRFVDQFSKQSQDEIYNALEKLNDVALIETLSRIGKQLTDTMEFNIYGAHKIDFATLLNIKKQITETTFYALDLPAFVEELNAGKVSKLEEAMKQIPEIFTSYRFLEYLLACIKNENIVTCLTAQKEKCNKPTWMEFKR